jgi:hypothetical protein
MPFICRTATTQDAAARPSVVSVAAVVVVVALSMAAGREAASRLFGTGAYTSWLRNADLRSLDARASLARTTSRSFIESSSDMSASTGPARTA